MTHPVSLSVDFEGEKYRRCAVALLFNPDGEVLVGERVDRSGSWGCPQGGVDEGETESQAAARELFEEVGVKVGDNNIRHLLEIEPDSSCFYRCPGSWMEKLGFVGQRLTFVAFHIPTREPPTSFCNLKGLNGEPAEFQTVKWQNISTTATDIWKPKQPAYQHAAKHLPKIISLISRI